MLGLHVCQVYVIFLTEEVNLKTESEEVKFAIARVKCAKSLRSCDSE